MPDTNTPAAAGTGEPASAPEVDVLDHLADILGDPETDTPEPEARKPAAAKAKPKSDADAVLDDGEADAADDATDENTDDTADDGPDEYAGGRFAADTARVKLPDGSTITVGELRKSPLRQSDYTRKTQELAEERKSFEAVQQRVSQVDQQLQEQFQRVNWWLDQTKPQKPQGSFADDPLAHGAYREQMDQWTEAQRYWAEEAKKAGEARSTASRTATEKYLRSEADALFKVVPALRDTVKRDAFVKEAAKAVADYGISEKEIQSLTDHRLILVLRDAVKYRRLQAKAPTVKDDLTGKPPIIRGSRRGTPATQQRTEIRQGIERLRKSGSGNDALSILEKMDL